LQDQLKERLTGAAILVVVVVLAVPEMFRGRPGTATPAGQPDGSAVPLRTVTLVDAAPPPAAGQAAGEPTGPQQGASPPPGNPPAEVAVPAQGAPAPASQAAPPLAAPATVPGPATAGAVPQAPVERSQPPAVAATQRAGPAVAPQAAPRPAPSTAPRAAPGKPAAHQAGPGSPAGAGWAVQVGSFRARELADRMAREVHAKGFKVHVVGPDPRGLYRVRSGLLPDREAALALKQQMVARGLKPIVNASP
jgi:DedD protein